MLRYIYVHRIETPNVNRTFRHVGCCVCVIPNWDSLCDLSHLSSIILCFRRTHHNLFRKEKKRAKQLSMNEYPVTQFTLSPSPSVKDRQYDTFFCRYAAAPTVYISYHLPAASSNLSSSENPPSPSLLLFYHTPSSNTEVSSLI